MPLFAAFIGPAYRARSENIAADELVNLFTEKTETNTEAKQATYYGTPGLLPLFTVGDIGCRGSWSQDGVTLSVVGDGIYQVDIPGRTFTYLGGIPDDGKPVSFASNGRGGEQLAICGGGQLKILSLLTLALSAPIVLPLTNAPVMVWFIEGYFLLSERDTIRVWFSNLENGTIWDALDFFARSDNSDNVVGICVLRNRVRVFGSITSITYYVTTDAVNPFQPYPGTVIQEGLVTPWALTVFGESVHWLAQDNQGRNRFVVDGGNYAPQTTSTPPISFALASYDRIDDCEVLPYEQEGHPFLCWTLPSAKDAGVTWSFDAREQEWHQRSTWNEDLGVEMLWRARGAVSTDYGILVGDRYTGDLYLLDMDTFTDNGAMIRRRRRAPYASAENQWLFLDRVELGIQSGVGLVSGQGVDPQLHLSISKDSGHTWLDAGTAAMGALGEYAARAIWYLLGRARADRLVLEVTSTDPVRQVWGPGLWLKARPGSGEL